MLISLSITNYALIDNLEIDFLDGFSVITGETGLSGNSNQADVGIGGMLRLIG